MRLSETLYVSENLIASFRAPSLIGLSAQSWS